MGLVDIPVDDALPILFVALVVLIILVSTRYKSVLSDEQEPHPCSRAMSHEIPSEVFQLIATNYKVTNHYSTFSTPSEFTYKSAGNVDEPLPLPSLGDRASVSLSIVIPAYDETERLKPMIDATLEHLATLPKRSYEILIVDDGSKDKTAELALKLSISHAATKTKNEIRVVRLETNRGKGGAVKHGFMHARGERILFVDADGATKFSALEVLWKAMDDIEEKYTGGPAIVVGSRAHLVGTEAVVKRSAIRNFLMYGFHFTLRVVGVGHIKDTQCGFKLFNRDAAQKVFPPLHLPTWIFDVELLLLARDLRIPVTEVQVDWMEIAGSKMNLAGATLGMVRDLVIMRANYLFGRWSAYDFVEV